MILLSVLSVAALLASDTGSDVEGAPKRKNAADTVRCVKLPVTGSLAQFRRICMTNREWEQNRDDAKRLQSLTCTNGKICQGS